MEETIFYEKEPKYKKDINFEIDFWAYIQNK